MPDVAGGPQREDTAAINVRVQFIGDSNYTDLGIWDKRSGGDLDSGETKYYPGNMQDPISLGGHIIPGNNTVSRLFQGARDQTILGRLFAGAGRSLVTLSEQPLDIDGNAYGNPIVWQGRLKKVTPPPRDSESETAALIELEISTYGRPTA